MQTSQPKPTRFVIEGEWTGYTSGQRLVVHRQVYPASRKHLREWAESAGAIRYTDGTLLLLRVRDCKPRERVEQIRSYSMLIEDCACYGVNSVDALAAARAALSRTA